VWIGRRGGGYSGDEEGILTAVRAGLSFGDLVIAVFLLDTKGVGRFGRVEGVVVLAGRETGGFTGGGDGDAVREAGWLFRREGLTGAVEGPEFP